MKSRALTAAAALATAAYAAILWGSASAAAAAPGKPDEDARSWTARAAAFLKRVAARLGEDNVSVLAAAVSFYSLLSIFPALTAVVSLYGLFADPSTVERELRQLEGLLPPAAVTLLGDWLRQLAERPKSTFGVGLVVSLAVSVWSARAATATMMTALNIAYEVPEKRGIVRFNFVALGLTLILIAFVGITVALVAVLPAVIGYLPEGIRGTATLARWPLLAALTMLAIAFFYRFAPNRTNPRWELASGGALVAMTLLVIGSYAFSIYVSDFATYDKTYGSLGAVVVLVLWFWLGALSVLVGAEFNAELAKPSARTDHG